MHIQKGTNPDIDSYSAFWDNKKLAKTDLVQELHKRAVTDIYVCGLAYDVCVGMYTDFCFRYFIKLLFLLTLRIVCHS